MKALFGYTTENQMIKHSAEKMNECGKVCSMTVSYSESPSKLDIVKNTNKEYYPKHQDIYCIFEM